MKHNTRLVITLLLVGCMSWGRAAAQQLQSGDLRFESISLEQGLSQSVVRSILQDRRGFLWFATQDGLNKYDGYTITVYRPEPGNSQSLSDQNICCMIEGDGDTLWLGTESSGLDRFNRSTGQVIHFKHRDDNKNSLSNNKINSIYMDHSGILWVGTIGGLDRYDPKSGYFTHYSYNQLDPTSLSHNWVRVIFEDRQGMLWIGTMGGGLNRLDTASGRFARYNHRPDDPHSLSDDSITAIFEDHAGALWIGTEHSGLNLMDRSAGSFVRYQNNPQNPQSLSHNSIQAIFEDSQGDLWIGTYGGGLNRLERGTEPANQTFARFRHIPSNPFSISNNHILSLYEDRSGVLWIGTYGGGVNKLELSGTRFTHLSGYPADTPGLENAMIGESVWSVFEDKDGILWIGTDSGLNRYDRRSGQWTHYLHDPQNPSSLSSDRVQAITQDQNGTLWIGTSGGGLNRLDSGSDRFIRYLHDENDPFSLAQDTVTSLLVDKQGMLWIGTNGFGLDTFDSRGERFIHYYPPSGNPRNFSNLSIWSIYEDRQGAIWLATEGAGVIRIAPVTGQSTQYVSAINNPASLSNNLVLSILEDQGGILWLGTAGGGLNRFDPVSQTFQRFGWKEGLPNDVVYGILEDQRGYLWLSTNNGLARFDPQDSSVINYNTYDGLQSAEFNSGAYFKNSKGEMFFGGINGVNIFTPENIGEGNLYRPPVVLTSLTQGGIPYQSNTSVDTLRQVTFSWPYNYFEFELAALSYVQPDKNRYAYRLENFDRDWNQAGINRYGRYTNLPGGTYRLRYKAANNDGVWNEEGGSLQIIIIPPIWQTRWFQLLVIAIIASVGVAGYRWRIRNIANREQELEQQVTQRSIELRAEVDQRMQIEEALRQSELEKAVIAERSRLARELHDAVTQTLFSASLIAEALPAAWESDPSQGHQLLTDLRQLSRGALAEMRALLMELRPAALLDASLEDLLRQLAEAVIGREGIQVLVNIEGKSNLPCDVHITLYRIAQEAINNVVKHARASQATIHLRYLSASHADEFSEDLEGVVMTVRDDGRGFDPEQVTPDHLGLRIMRERAQAIGATITVESQPGHGSQITVLWEQETQQIQS